MRDKLELKVQLTGQGNLRGEVSGARREVERFGDSTDRMGRQASGNFGRTRAGVESISQQLAVARRELISFISVQQGLRLAGEFKDVVASGQDLRARLEGITGSAEAAAQAQDYLAETADRLSANQDALTDSFIALTNLQNLGAISAAQRNAILEGTVNASKEAGLASAQLGQMMYGMQQALSSSIVTMEDYRQVTEPVPGLHQRIAEAAGMTGSALRELIGSAQVSGQQLAQWVVQALATYDGAAERMRANINSQFERVGNAWRTRLREFEAPVSFGAEAGADVAMAAIEHLDDLLAAVAVTAATRTGPALARMFEAQKSAVRQAIETVREHQAAIAEDLARSRAALAQANVADVAARERAATVRAAAAIESDAAAAGVAAAKARGRAERDAAAEVVAAVRAEQAAIVARAEAAELAAAQALTAARQRVAAALETGIEGPQRAAVLRDQVAAEQALAAAAAQTAAVRTGAAQAIGAAEAQAAEVATTANARLAAALDGRTSATLAAGHARAGADAEVAAAAQARARANDAVTASETRLAAATRATAQATALLRRGGAALLGVLGGWPGVLAGGATALGLWALANREAAESVEEHTASIDEQIDALDKLGKKSLDALRVRLERDIEARRASVRELAQQIEQLQSPLSGRNRTDSAIARRADEATLALGRQEKMTEALRARESQLADVRARLAGQQVDTAGPITPAGPDSKDLKAAGEYLDKLREQTAEIGLNRDALIRLQAARVADAVAGTEQAAAIRAAAEAMIAQTRATEALRAEKERQDAELAEYAQAERDVENARIEGHRRAIEAIEQERLHFAGAAERMRAEARQWRDEQLPNLDMNKAGYEDFALEIEDIYTGRLAEAQEQALRDSTDWRDGAKRALRDYEEAAVDVAAGVEDATRNGLRGMEDALTQFVTTGKLSFSDLVNSILADLARIAIRQSITGPLASALGSVFGGGLNVGTAVSYGTNVGSEQTAMLAAQDAAFRLGGIMTSAGPVPLRAYAGGGIADRPQVALFGEGDVPEAYVPLPDGRRIPVVIDQQDAPVAAIRAAVQSAMPAMAQAAPVAVHLHVVEDRSRAGQAEQSRRQDGGVDLRMFVAMIKGDLVEDISGGRGPVGQAIGDRFGLSPVGGQF